mmetsp:Transcript_36048/g.90760  ORF Transcript_36048/g.90760 Transcript_36048/m.90760 type:complete len:169 (-) Transcript_36048:563-1069(-)
MVGLFRDFRESGLGHPKSSHLVRAMSISSIPIDHGLGDFPNLAEFNRAMLSVVRMDVAPIQTLAAAPVTRNKAPCWACCKGGHRWSECRNKDAVNKFKLKYADPKPQPEDNDDDMFRRAAFHAHGEAGEDAAADGAKVRKAAAGARKHVFPHDEDKYDDEDGIGVWRP